MEDKFVVCAKKNHCNGSCFHCEYCSLDVNGVPHCWYEPNDYDTDISTETIKELELQNL